MSYRNSSSSSSSSSSLDPDALLKKLRRLEGNSICPNCGTHAPQGIGFSSICVKFKTFVCDLCKTSHQAISHRVKSVSMSTWTFDEVNELTSSNNGGNDAARHIWLKNAPECGGRYNGGSRPKQGDKVEVFKQFVIDCYERGLFKATTPFVPSMDNVSSSTTIITSAATSNNNHVKVTSSLSSSSSSSSSSLSKSKPVVKDMLAFDEPVKSTSKSSSSSSNDMIDFLSAPSSNNDNDTFGSFTSASTTTSHNTSTFDPFGGNNTLMPTAPMTMPTAPMTMPTAPMNAPMSVFQNNQMMGMSYQYQVPNMMPNNMNMMSNSMGISAMPSPMVNGYMHQQQQGMPNMMMGNTPMGMNMSNQRPPMGMNMYPPSNMGMHMMNNMNGMNMNPPPLSYSSSVMQANPNGSSISTMNMNSPTRGIINNNSSYNSNSKKDAFDFIKLS